MLIQSTNSSAAGLILFLVAFITIPIVVVVAIWRRERELDLKGTRTMGKVISRKRKINYEENNEGKAERKVKYSYCVSYNTIIGLHQLYFNEKGSYPNLKESQQIEVVYWPSNPLRARITDHLQLYRNSIRAAVGAVIAAIFGLPFLMILLYSLAN